MRFIFHECRNLFRAAAAHIVEAQSIEIRLFLINERNYSHARAEIMRWVSIKTLLWWHAMIDMAGRHYRCMQTPEVRAPVVT